MKKSISTRLLVITLSVSIIGMGLIAAVSMTMSASSLLQESLGKIGESTEREAVRINSWLENQAHYVSALATGLAYDSDYSAEALMPMLMAHKSANGQYFEVYMGHPDGTGSFASGWIPDYAGGWTSYKRGWYIGAAQNPGTSFITSLYTDAQTGELCVTISNAVIQSGSVVGVAAADMYIDTLDKIVNETNVGQDSYAFLTDASGGILIYPNGAYSPDKDDNFQNITQIENGLYKTMWESTSQNRESFKFQGADGVVRYYTMHEIDATGWRLYTALPASVVNAPIYRLFYLVVPIFVVILLLAAILMFFTVKRLIVRPITDITSAAHKLADGDTNIELTEEYEGELHMLRESFLNMADSIQKQVESTSQFAVGNLDVNVQVRSSTDVMGQALDQLCHKLNVIMGIIHQGSIRVSEGSNQISTHSQSLAQGASEQAAAIQQLSASINEITEKIRSNQEKASQASDVSEQIYKNARNGMELMEQMVVAVTEINDASSSISKVIKAIEDIAFQTNILALNAAVEAARAGQHGKGFAVVADEVRNLASKSAEAARETADLIQNSISKASDGAGIAEKTNQALETVISALDESAKLISQISAAANEEFEAITSINEGINQVSQVVQSNAATSQEEAAEAQRLSAEAGSLSKAVSSFTLKNDVK